MANYATLKAAIASVIKTNGNEEITGEILQNAIIALIESLGAKYQFAGIATPGSSGTDPGTPDYNVMYIAGVGTYPNFGGTDVEKGHIGVFVYNGSWNYQTIETGAYFEFEEYPDGAAVEFTFYDSENPDGKTIKINKDVSGLGNAPDEAISQWWAAQMKWKLQDVQGYTDTFPSLSTSVQSLGLFGIIKTGKVIDSITGANKLIFVAEDSTEYVVTPSDLPYKALADLVSVKLESGTASNVSIHVRGEMDMLISHININEIANHPAAYANAATALGDVPTLYRRKGMKVVYFDDTQQLWIEMINVDDAGVNWWTDVTNNWIIEGPIETDVTTPTGGKQLMIGGVKKGNLDDVLNVNVWNEQATEYATQAAARAAVPANKRKLGAIITYLVTTGTDTNGWMIDEYIGSSISDWTVADNWKTIGPVSVTQNTETGHDKITIGGVDYETASVEDVNQLGQQLSSIGAFPIIFNIDGGINASDGVDAPNYDYKRTDYIPVKQGQVLNYDVWAGSTGWATIACYDSSFAYNFAASVKGTSNGTFVIPSGISFVRLSSSKAYANTFGKIQFVSDDISDGVVSFAKLKKELFAELNRGIGLFLLDGGVGYADGTIALDPGTGRKTTYFIAVKEGERIDYTCYAGSAGWAAVAAYDTSFNYIQSASIAGIPGLVTPNIGTYVVPNGVAYVVMCGLATEENKYALDNSLTPTQEAEIDEKIITYNGDLPFNVDGGINATTGEDANHEAYNRTDYISVQEGDIINASIKENNNAWGAFALYDSQKNYITTGSIAGTGSVQNINIIIPDGVSFIRLASQKNYASWATKNRVLRENDIKQETEVTRVNEVSIMKYPNILQQRGCIAIQMDLGYLDNARSGCDSMIEVMREYGLMSMDYAINITALQDAEIDKLLERQKEGCEIIYHNRINSPSDFSENSTLTVAELKEGVLDERLAMTQKGFTTFGVVANVGSLATRYKPTIDNIFFWSEYGSAQIMTSGAENSKAQYLTDHRIIRTGFEIRHSDYTAAVEAEMIAKGKAWVDNLCDNKTFGVMYCHFYDRPTTDDYHLYEGVLRAMCEYIAEKISDGELWFGSTTECLNYLCR